MRKLALYGFGGLTSACLCLLYPVCLQAEPTRNFESGVFLEEPQEPAPPFWEHPSYPEIPDFMRHWEFGFNIDEGQGPRYFADLILPLWRPVAQDRTVFIEPRFNHADSETLFNLGLGYRQLLRDPNWLVGGNLFYDIESQYSHYRLGAGLEAISAYAELRANSYFGLSRERISKPGDAQNTIQKAVDGFDLELGLPVPYYSRLKFFGGYEWYNFEKFENRQGWTVRAEYTPTPAVVIDATLSDNNKRDTGWGLTVAFRPPFWQNHPKETRSPLQLDETFFPDGDVSERLYIPVERHHEIVVESFIKTEGQITVEVARGT